MNKEEFKYKILSQLSGEKEWLPYLMSVQYRYTKVGVPPYEKLVNYFSPEHLLVISLTNMAKLTNEPICNVTFQDVDEDDESYDIDGFRFSEKFVRHCYHEKIKVSDKEIKFTLERETLFMDSHAEFYKIDTEEVVSTIYTIDDGTFLDADKLGQVQDTLKNRRIHSPFYTELELDENTSDELEELVNRITYDEGYSINSLKTLIQLKEMCATSKSAFSQTKLAVVLDNVHKYRNNLESDDD